MAETSAQKKKAIDKWMAASHTPEAIAKAVASRRKTLLAKKRAAAIEKKTHPSVNRRSFNDQDKAHYVALISADVNGGMMIKDACRKHKLNTTQYRDWKFRHTEKKSGGTTTTIDVSSLPQPPSRGKPRSGRRRIYTAKERLKLAAIVEKAVANGDQIKAAAAKAGIHDSLYYNWIKNKKHFMTEKAPLPMLNGHKVNGGAAQVILHVSGLSVQVAGKPIEMSLQDAIRLQQGLDSLMHGRGG